MNASICQHRRRGFTTMVGIAMIGLVAAALLSLSALLSYEARRTRQASEEAQLRQLLLAGAASAIERSAGWQPSMGAPTWKLSLPTVLGDREATVRLSAEGPEALVAQVTAQADGRRLQQTLRLAKEGKEWRMSRAALD